MSITVRVSAGRMLGLVAIVLSAILAAPAESQPIQGAYIYTLAGFTGLIRQDFSRVAVDRERNEVYILFQNVIRVFNDSGMEIYQFGDDLEVGPVIDVALDEQGDPLLLVYRDSGPVIVRCNYRGEPQSEITLKGLSGVFKKFDPNRIVYQRGRFYLASSIGLQIVIADREGAFTRGYDLFPLLELEEKDRGNVDLGGFSVDGQGNMLMTVPVLFRAVVLSPEGAIRSFGKASSAPGGFNIVGGIARDSKGNILVIDRLKGAVLVFDPKLAFVTQFATRGYRSNELIFPADLALDGRDRAYVTQMGRRGVSVFQLTYLR